MESKILLKFSFAIALSKELSCNMKCLCYCSLVFIGTSVFETLTKLFCKYDGQNEFIVK